MARSLRLEAVMSTPGVFWSDNPYAWPEQTFKSDNDDLSYAPFHCHIVRSVKNQVEDKFTAAHILYGQSQAISLGLGKVGSANKFDRLNGWGKLFTSTRGPLRRSENHDVSGENWNQQSGYCPTMLTENMIPHPTGVFIGRETPDEFGLDTSADVSDDEKAFYDSKARWTSPIGCQFKWSSRGSKKAAGAINFTKIALIYMDNWNPGRTLYMPLVDTTDEGRDEETGGGGFGKFRNEQSFYRGSDPFHTEYGSSASGDDRHGYKFFGEIIAYAQPEVLDYMADPFTRCACVGMYIELMQPKGQGSWYDICREVFDFKLLYDMPDKRGNRIAANSKIIYPAPYPLRDALFGDGKSIKII